MSLEVTVPDGSRVGFDFYVTVVDGERKGFLLGPYKTHAEALACVERGKKLAENANDRATWYGFGTASAPHEVPVRVLFPEKNGPDVCLFSGCSERRHGADDPTTFRPDFCWKHQTHGFSACSVACCGVKRHPGECDESEPKKARRIR